MAQQLNLAPGSKVIVLADSQPPALVFVTSANLASVFTGQPYDSDKSQWGPVKLYAYEQIIGVVKRIESPVKTG